MCWEQDKKKRGPGSWSWQDLGHKREVKPREKRNEVEGEGEERRGTGKLQQGCRWRSGVERLKQKTSNVDRWKKASFPLAPPHTPPRRRLSTRSSTSTLSIIPTIQTIIFKISINFRSRSSCETFQKIHIRFIRIRFRHDWIWLIWSRWRLNCWTWWRNIRIRYERRFHLTNFDPFQQSI